MIDILSSWWFIGLISLCIGLVIGLIGIDFSKPDGVIYISEDEEKDKYLFEFNILPEEIPNKKHIIFKVKNVKSQKIQTS